MLKNPQNNPTNAIANKFILIDKKIFFYFLIFVGIYWITSLYQAVISSLVLGILLAYLLQPI